MEESEPPRDIKWGPLVGGMFLGWLASWAALFVTVLTVWPMFGDDGFGRATWPNVVIEVSLWVPALILGVGVLWQRLRSQMVAAVLLGGTIGAIAGAGVCRVVQQVG